MAIAEHELIATAGFFHLLCPGLVIKFSKGKGGLS